MQKTISADGLKAIALVTMVLDHIGVVLFPEAVWLRAIGRISFPLFTWLLVMGFMHTSNLRKYAVSMGIFALLSEVPFDLAVYGRMEPGEQNVFFTLFLDLVMLYLVSYSWDRCRAAAVPAIVATMVLAEILHVDYGCRGILLAAVFYCCARTGKPNLFWGYGLFCLARFLVPLFTLQPLTDAGMWMRILDNAVFDSLGIFSVFLIERCNGIRKWKRGKYLFYFFYPLHLLLLFGFKHIFLA